MGREARFGGNQGVVIPETGFDLLNYVPLRYAKCVHSSGFRHKRMKVEVGKVVR
jgi:hypothetical protein